VQTVRVTLVPFARTDKQIVHSSAATAPTLLALELALELALGNTFELALELLELLELFCNLLRQSSHARDMA
jgi:hypothetical protein